MAKNSKKTRGISLIELLNKATSYQTKSNSEAKEDIKGIKQMVRSKGWEKTFLRLMEADPNWVEQAMKEVKYEITKYGTEKGGLQGMKNGIAVLKVVM